MNLHPVYLPPSLRLCYQILYKYSFCISQYEALNRLLSNIYFGVQHTRVHLHIIL